jgi:hypothetical protein
MAIGFPVYQRILVAERTLKASKSGWIVGLLMWLVLATPALAASKLALVIGNDAYQNLEQLSKAVADAKAYTELLRTKGFQVRSAQNLTYGQMNAEVAAFVALIQPGDTAVFVYSGHGWSDGSTNYLVGIDAPRSVSQDELIGITVPLKNGVTGVLDRVERKGAHLRIAIVDACRGNPFAPPPGTKGVSYSRGLAPMAPQLAGTYVIFSASSGEGALDRLSEADANPNSVFTRVFLPYLAADMTLLDAIKATQTEVVRISGNAERSEPQKPAYYDEVVGSACLVDRCRQASDTSMPIVLGTERPSSALQYATMPVGAQLVPTPGEVSGSGIAMISADGKILYSSCGTSQFEPNEGPSAILSWNIDTGREIKFLKAPSGAVRFDLSRNGAQIVSGAHNQIAIQDLSDGRVIRTIDTETEGLASIFYSPTANQILTSGYGAVQLWDPVTGKENRKLFSYLTGVVSAYSPNGKLIVTGGDHDSGLPDKDVIKLTLWSTADGRLIRRFERQFEQLPEIHSVAFSPTEDLLVAGEGSGQIVIWDILTGREVRTIQAQGAVDVIDFSPDGTRILSSSNNRSVEVWDFHTGKLLATLDGNNRAPQSARYSRDGRRIVTCGADGTTKLWDARTGDLLATFFVANGKGAAYNSDGLFVTEGDPRKAFKILRGSRELPLEDFITMNRRDNLFINRPSASARQ